MQVSHDPTLGIMHSLHTPVAGPTYAGYSEAVARGTAFRIGRRKVVKAVRTLITLVPFHMFLAVTWFVALIGVLGACIMTGTAFTAWEEPVPTFTAVTLRTRKTLTTQAVAGKQSFVNM